MKILDAMRIEIALFKHILELSRLKQYAATAELTACESIWSVCQLTMADLYYLYLSL